MKQAQSPLPSSEWSHAVRSTIGSRVRALRHQLAISQEELGFTCGLHPCYVSQVELGKRNLSVESILRIAAGLGVFPGELFRPLEETLLPELNKRVSRKFVRLR